MTSVFLGAKLTSDNSMILDKEFPFYMAGNLTLSVQHRHGIRHKSIAQQE